MTRLSTSVLLGLLSCLFLGSAAAFRECKWVKVGDRPGYYRLDFNPTWPTGPAKPNDTVTFTGSVKHTISTDLASPVVTDARDTNTMRMFLVYTDTEGQKLRAETGPSVSQFLAGGSFRLRPDLNDGHWTIRAALDENAPPSEDLEKLSLIRLGTLDVSRNPAPPAPAPAPAPAPPAEEDHKPNGTGKTAVGSSLAITAALGAVAVFMVMLL